ncbi:SMP-30/gluconolactonase/LRE family protein [Novosphingobium sp.]|uniref:SMP-30/gluconolactonase/LRE family protein n=1 Tax=Novosphingobium sp. TaxID=1874826 RepID=UPI001E191D11|nr:SMP-30/gluconolactonase/LRE family protein [Novosphingobium sp.]MBX9664208.1 SMP-30/gluconolactonase/LRE family protein [Novosphingobium sp.]
MSRAVRQLADGFHFGEGPRWHEGRLWFSDFYSHTIRSVDLAGNHRIELEVDDQPSGLGWMPDGALIYVSMRKRQVWRRWPDGRLAMHADLADLTAHLCNDMVVDAEGRAYVGNFGFDLDQELRARGVPAVLADHPRANLVLVQADGSVSVASPDMSFPNGTVITPDGKTLIIGETLGGRLTAFDIGEGGALSRRRLWADTMPRVPDGIALDAEGAVWIANPIAPECARIAEGGEVLEVVSTGEMPCYACMLGGPDGRHLFMLCAPSSDAEVARSAAKGVVLVAEVDAGRAGLP